MKNYITLLLIAGVLIVIGLLRKPAHKWSRQHVNYITAVDDHPLNCLSCHMYIQKDGVVAKLINADYLSPFNMAVSAEGSKLYVIAQEGNALLVVDTETDKVIDKIAVGENPHSVILKKDGNTAFVSNQWADNVYEIDLTSSKIIDTLKTGSGPAGLVLSADEKFLYVVDSYSSEVSIIDLQTRTELKRLMAGNNPVAATFSPDRSQVYVTSRRTLPMPYGTPPMTELTVIDAATQRVKERKIFENAYIMENVAFTPSGDMAIATLIRPKNLIPAIQVERGWMMTHGIGIIEPGNNGRIIQLLTDEPNAYYSDPFDIVITPDGEKAFVSHSGVDYVTVIDLKGPSRITVARKGRRILNNSGHTFQNQYACYTCHPPPYFTNMKMADVGTLSETDDPMLFDAPQLNNVYESAPYLHDGRAATLEELWTTFNDEDKHGVGNDMMKDQLNDLVEYLRSLRDAKYYKDDIEIYKAGIDP